MKTGKKKKTKFNPERCVTSRLNLRCAVIKSDRGSTKGCYISFQMVKPAASGTLCPGTLINGPSNRWGCVLTRCQPTLVVQEHLCATQHKHLAATSSIAYAICIWISFLILHKRTDLIFMILSFEVLSRQIITIIILDTKVLFSVGSSKKALF